MQGVIAKLENRSGEIYVSYSDDIQSDDIIKHLEEEKPLNKVFNDVKVEVLESQPIASDPTISAKCTAILSLYDSIFNFCTNPALQEYKDLVNIDDQGFLFVVVRAIFNMYTKELAFIRDNNSEFISNLVENADMVPKLMYTPKLQDRVADTLQYISKSFDELNYQKNVIQEMAKYIHSKNLIYENKVRKSVLREILGQKESVLEEKLESLGKYFQQLSLPEKVSEYVNSTLKKLSQSASLSQENTYNMYAHLEWISKLPWNKYSDGHIDIDLVESILNKEHFGLEDTKRRILEVFTVAAIKGNMDGKCICLVGPPGVGKTSIAKSIATALNKSFQKFSVGGLSDSNELKGHRRAYIGSMPGNIIQALIRSKSMNPVILIDEIDKTSKQSYGPNPQNVFLEILDPEINDKFIDHYIDLPVDISKVFFICTANDVSLLSRPLRDRMEIINIGGYLNEEKREIIEKYIIPKQLDEAGLTKANISINNAALNLLIEEYSRSPGVRNLEKCVSRIVRAATVKILEKNVSKVNINANNLSKFVGTPSLDNRLFYEEEQVGVVRGLTVQGGYDGSVLYIEAIGQNSKSPSIQATGRMGDIAQESIKVAFSHVKLFLESISPGNTYFNKKQIHLHFPRGGVPKDGPSAGTAIATSILSLALNLPVPTNIGMTGELSLNGLVLPIGGCKEKIIGAKRDPHISKIIFPERNREEVERLPDMVKQGVEIVFATTFRDIVGQVFPNLNVNN
eukprot:TRINITY_DN2373_c3_g1_i1.p1 TRINITY_DN2373_c3_g1~~TRINITY_DN2373_c3_g1_i1.p1  ORF type:complete len:850 (-),score=185.43 TRINITY_DN2373_c3_g1_i1:28-2247(-)